MNLNGWYGDVPHYSENFLQDNLLPKGYYRVKHSDYTNSDLEDLCKKENKQLFVIAGGIFHSKQKINNVVTVPDSCFKIAIVLEKGQTLKDITEQTPIIAVVMSNIAGVRRDSWEIYKTTISRIESSTGYSFLNRINKNIRNVLKSK